MSLIETSSLQPAGSIERKRWETPIVIVGSTRRETLSNVNTPAVDAIATTGSSYGS